MVPPAMDPAVPPLLLLVSPWMGSDGLEYLGLGILLVSLAILLVLYSLASRLRRPDELLERLQHLERIEATLDRIAEQHAELDLRRLEHTLLDIRAALRQADERSAALADSIEQSRDASAGPDGLSAAGSAAGLADRVTNRLIALGFEQIEILTPLEELEAFALVDGEVIVEARRAGALHKGRLAIRDGGIADVHLRASYEVFP